jgi:pilus assembly protein FimV
VDSKNRDAFHKHFVQLQGTANAQTIGRAKELLLGVDDAPEWLGEKRNTQEMPTVTMPEIDDDMLAAEDDALLAVNDEVPVEDEGDTREMGIVELEDTGDFDFSSFGAKEAEKAADDEPETIDLGVSDDLDFLAGTDESGTKLDLARAYIDMGDIDGAKEILQEVIQDGNSGAKDEARKLLDSI